MAPRYGAPHAVLRAPPQFCRGRAGTRAHSRELILDYCRIAVRKLHPFSTRSESAGSAARPGRTRPSQADSKLAALYQDTFEAPIPQDMLRLLEKIGAGADEEH
jgi:hypothetical protein